MYVKYTSPMDGMSISFPKGFGKGDTWDSAGSGHASDVSAHGMFSLLLVAFFLRKDLWTCVRGCGGPGVMEVYSFWGNLPKPRWPFPNPKWSKQRIAAMCLCGGASHQPGWRFIKKTVD